MVPGASTLRARRQTTTSPDDAHRSTEEKTAIELLKVVREAVNNELGFGLAVIIPTAS